MGSQAIPVGPQPVQLLQLFNAESVTIFNSGPDTVYLSPDINTNPASGIPLSKNASTQWDPGQDCYAVTDSGIGHAAIVRLTSNSGALFDPSAIAEAILDQGLAEDIAADIAITPPSASSIVELVKIQAVTTATGRTTGDFSSFYQNGQRYDYPLRYSIYPASNFRVRKLGISARNPTNAVARFTAYLHRSLIPLQLYAQRTLRIPAATTDYAGNKQDGLVNWESEFNDDTDTLLLGDLTPFFAQFGFFCDTVGIEFDLSFLCATYGGTASSAGGNSAAPPPPPPTPPAFIAATTSTGGLPAVGALPTFSAGNLLVAAIQIDRAQTLTVPTGWTLQASVALGYNNVWVFTKIATGGEISFPVSSSLNSGTATIHVASYTHGTITATAAGSTGTSGNFGQPVVPVAIGSCVFHATDAQSGVTGAVISTMGANAIDRAGQRVGTTDFHIADWAPSIVGTEPVQTAGGTNDNWAGVTITFS